VTVDLGGSRTFTGVRTLFAGSTMSGIYFPREVVVEYSGDGGASWSSFGGATLRTWELTLRCSTRSDGSMRTSSTPVIASQVRVTVNFYEWLFIGEIKVMDL
jgi:hypothetical protein